MSSRLRQWLENDHREIESFFADAVSNPEFGLAAFNTARERLMRHIAIEEKIVFRAVRDIVDLANREPALLQALRDARIDHAAITTLLVPMPDKALVSEFVLLLEPHNVLEEAPDGIYAQCDRVLGDATDALVIEAMAYPPVSVRDYDVNQDVVRTAAEARAKAERVRPTLSW